MYKKKNYRVCGHFGLKKSSHHIAQVCTVGISTCMYYSPKLCDTYLSIETNERADKSQKGITPIWFLMNILYEALEWSFQ